MIVQFALLKCYTILNTKTVLLIFPFLQTNITIQMSPSEGYGPGISPLSKNESCLKSVDETEDDAHDWLEQLHQSRNKTRSQFANSWSNFAQSHNGQYSVYSLFATVQACHVKKLLHSRHNVDTTAHILIVTCTVVTMYKAP